MQVLQSSEVFCTPDSTHAAAAPFGMLVANFSNPRSHRKAAMTPPHTSVPPRKVLSLKLRVKRFYADNPKEELTFAGLMTKFNCTRRAARWIVSELAEEGMLESTRVIRLRTAGIATEEA